VSTPTTWSLALDLTAPGRARALVAAHCVSTHPELPSAAWDVAMLLLTELVTNAVRYGAGPVGLRLTDDATRFRVDVADHGPGGPVLGTDADLLAERGRGLQLVDALARAWGVTRGEDGKQVWFELPPLPSPRAT
jgi:anti-sigma regulatory factor (Ser/Thr protein kinase)